MTIRKVYLLYWWPVTKFHVGLKCEKTEEMMMKGQRQGNYGFSVRHCDIMIMVICRKNDRNVTTTQIAMTKAMICFECPPSSFPSAQVLGCRCLHCKCEAKRS
jgi:hypothetical protein